MDTESAFSDHHFVLRFKKEEELAELESKLREIGEIERLKGAKPDEILLEIRLTKKSEAARETWEALVEQLGDAVDLVEPVVFDKKGEPSVPDGTVTVRFCDEPSEQDLKGYEESHGLKAKKRNAYVPSQVTFERLDSLKQFLPEIVEELETKVSSVKKAWPTTRSRYRNR